MAAGKLDLLIEQGSEFEQILEWKDVDGTEIDLTGFKAEMHVRSRKDSKDIILELTSENGRIVLGGLTGQITLVIPSSITSAIEWSEAVYDLKLISPGDKVERLLEGKVIVSEAVTR